MAANVTLLMSLLANVLGSGIIFFSGPPADLKFLQENTNISIYDVDQLSPMEEKSLGDNNIFLDFNQHFGGKLSPKVIQLAGEHKKARIMKAHKGVCDRKTFEAVVSFANSKISNQNKTHVVFHLCQFNATSFLLSVSANESYIYLNSSAMDTCGRYIGYETTNIYLKPTMVNMRYFIAGAICKSDRYCYGLKKKPGNASNPLILKSLNCYDDCAYECPKGEYLDSCVCHPEHYDWLEHLKKAFHDLDGLLLGWLIQTSSLVIFVSVYSSRSVGRRKYLYPLVVLLISFPIASYFAFNATLNERGSKTGNCTLYLFWNHLFNPNILLIKLLVSQYDKISFAWKAAITVGSISTSLLFFIVQQVARDPSSELCSGLNLQLADQIPAGRIYHLHLLIVGLFVLAWHAIRSDKSSSKDKFMAAAEFLFLFSFDSMFNTPRAASYPKDSLEIMLKTEEMALTMTTSMINDLINARARSEFEPASPTPQHTAEMCPLQLHNNLNTSRRSSSLPAKRPLQVNSNSNRRANTI